MFSRNTSLILVEGGFLDSDMQQPNGVIVSLLMSRETKIAVSLANHIHGSPVSDIRLE